MALELTSVHRTIRVGLPRCHASVRVLRGVGLRVGCGEMVGVAGGQGAGKTTLLLCAAGLMRPDAGSIAWPAAGTAAQGWAAYVGARPRFYAPLTVREAAMGGAPPGGGEVEVDHALQTLGLRGVAEVAVGRLPREARCRIAVARAMASGARLLLLDEPFTGVGRYAAASLRAALRSFAARDGAVIITARERRPLDAVATRVVSLRGGRLDDDNDVAAHAVPRFDAARRAGRRVAEEGPAADTIGRRAGVVDPSERRS